MLKYAFMLTLALVLYWIIMSGIYTPMILILGVISITLVVLLTWRMKILDVETVPYHNIPKALSYYVWLFVEIVKANVQVVRAVLSPNLEVSPTLIRVPARQTSEIGKTVFANSITLTPGTVSMEMEGDMILVHALLSEMANPDDFAEMGERSSWSVGEDVAVPAITFEEAD